MPEDYGEQMEECSLREGTAVAECFLSKQCEVRQVSIELGFVFPVSRDPGVFPHKGEGGSRRKHSSNTPKRYQNLVLWACPKFISPSSINSTTANYITGTANFNSTNDNFRTLSSQGLFESMVRHLYPD